MMQLDQRAKGKHVPTVGKRSRAIRPLTMTSGITVPVSKRAKKRCNAPTNLPPASAWCLWTPAARRSREAQPPRGGGPDHQPTARASLSRAGAASEECEGGGHGDERLCSLPRASWCRAPNCGSGMPSGCRAQKRYGRRVVRPLPALPRTPSTLPSPGVSTMT